MNLPPMGRKGIDLARRLSGVGNPGWKKVDEAVEFMSGMVAANGTDSDGNDVITVCDNTKLPVGIFSINKATNFYSPQVDEAVTFTTSTQYLKYAYCKNLIVKTSTGSVITSSGNYTADLTHGTITRLSGIPAGRTVYVSYSYKDMNIAGVDQTVATGLVTIFNLPGEIGTMVYDTGHDITVGDEVHCNADGLLSTDTGLTTHLIGHVTQKPTAENPELVLLMNIR